MTKPVDTKRSAEIHSLVAWGNAVVDALALTRPEFATSILRGLLDKGAATQNLKRLREFADELGRMTADLPTDERSSLDARLREAFRRGLFRERDGGLARILKRGSIKTDDEFRLLSDQLDDLEKAASLDEVRRAKITRMIVAYEESR